MENVTKTLVNGEVLTLSIEEENGATYYKARVSSDISNTGFEGDNGIVKDGETLESIAEEIEGWLNDNLNQ